MPVKSNMIVSNTGDPDPAGAKDYLLELSAGDTVVHIEAANLAESMRLKTIMDNSVIGMTRRDFKPALMRAEQVIRVRVGEGEPSVIVESADGLYTLSTTDQAHAVLLQRSLGRVVDWYASEVLAP